MSDNATAEEMMESLEKLEDFFEYLEVEFDPELVKSRRVPLLRLYHVALESLPEEKTYEQYQRALQKAYKQLQWGESVKFAESSCGDCTSCDDGEDNRTVDCGV